MPYYLYERVLGNFSDEDETKTPLVSYQYYEEKNILKKELDQLFKAVKGDPLELAVILGAFYGLRRSEVVWAEMGCH